MDKDEAKILEENELELVNGGAMGPTSSEKIEQGIIQNFSKRFGVPVDAINSNTKLGDLGADSLDVVDIVSCVEEEFGIKIPIISPVSTVGDVINLIP